MGPPGRRIRRSYRLACVVFRAGDTDQTQYFSNDTNNGSHIYLETAPTSVQATLFLTDELTLPNESRQQAR
ncbi:hypothetical protein HDF09_003603 [Edaphobacter lichenicola]|uniref:Uncharacterized protein n=1 Tax=Tunturiibacter empetritectus TaxID=3069691 RepID=A0A7W8IKT4_9BACT|nr:hypothetical protein [Edaphobacter lichenicola]